MKRALSVICVVALAGIAYWGLRPSPFDSVNPLLSDGAPVHFLDGLDTESLPDGWVLRTFFRVTPADYQMTQEDGKKVLRCTTDNSASILARDTEIAVSALPILSWRWKVTQPIESDVDEATKAGDDHPVRLFLMFANEAGESRATEIIWSNQKYSPGDYKIIGSFYHYVANGLNQNIGQWHEQSIDLRQLYSEIGGTGAATLQTFGFFCDSDNTGARSDGLFGDVLLSPDLQ
jgi:hypothetical protein